MHAAPAPVGRLGPALLAGLLVLPFLQPLHGPPFQFFETEWLATALGLAGALALLGHPAGCWPRAAWLLLALAAWVALQPWVLDIPYPQNHAAPAALLAWAALLLAAGRSWQRAAPDPAALADRLAGALLAAGLLNAGAGLLQVLGPEGGLPAWLVYSDRKSLQAATGQLRHQGHYVLLLGWSLAALLWLDARGRLGGGGRPASWMGWPAALALALLALGMALSTQRAVLVYAALPGLLALALRDEGTGLRRALRRRAALALAAVLAAVLFTPALAASVGADTLHTALGRGAQSAWSLRLPMWGSAWAAGTAHPWTGLGHDGYTAFHALRAHGLADFRYTTHAHNLPLHVLATLGAPALGLLLGLAAAWAWGLGRAWRDPARALPLAWLGMAAASSMIELPSHVAHFLGPIALLLGLSWRGDAPPALGRPGRLALALGGLLGALALAWTLAAFWALNRPWREALPPAVRIATLEAATAHPVLAAVADSVLDDLLPLDARGWSPAQRQAHLDRNARGLAWRPTARVMHRRAALLQLAGQPAEARAALDRARAVHPALTPGFLAHLCRGRGVDTAALRPLVDHARAWPGFTLPAACEAPPASPFAS